MIQNCAEKAYRHGTIVQNLPSAFSQNMLGLRRQKFLACLTKKSCLLDFSKSDSPRFKTRIYKTRILEDADFLTPSLNDMFFLHKTASFDTVIIFITICIYFGGARAR